MSYLPVIKILEGSSADNFQGDVNAGKGGEIDGLTARRFSDSFHSENLGVETYCFIIYMFFFFHC